MAEYIQPLVIPRVRPMKNPQQYPASYFSPNTSTKCVLWFDCFSYFTLNGAAMSGWADQSPLREHYGQNIAANQPVFNAGSLNGRYSMTFDGTNDRLGIQTTTLDLERTAPWTSFIVVKRTGTGDIFFSDYDTTATRGVIFSGVDGSGNLNVVVSNTFASNRIDTTFGALTSGTWYVISTTYDGSSTAAGVNAYVDGVARTRTIVGNNLSATVINTKTPIIGAGNNGSHMAGSIAAVGLYTKLMNVAERKKIEKYLGYIYGITVT